MPEKRSSFSLLPMPIASVPLCEALWEKLGDPAILLEASGRLAAINPAGLSLLGKTAEAIVGKDWFELAVAAKDRERGRALLPEVLASARQDRPHTVALDLLTPAGPWPAQWHFSALPGTDAGAVWILGCGHDRSEPHRMEMLSRACEDDYRRIFNTASDALFIQEVGTGKFLDANERALALFGYTLAELRQLTPAALGAGVPPYSGDAILAKVSPGCESEPQLFEWLAKDKSGQRFWTEVHLRCGAFKGQERIIAVVRDIRKRREAEQALRTSEEKFRQLAEAIDEVFWLGSPDWKRVFYISPAYERLWGRTCQSLYAAPLSWLEGVAPQDREAIDKALQARGRQGLPEPGILPEFRILRPDGSLRWVQCRYFPVHDASGALTRMAAIIEDITERKQARQTLERLTERLEIMVRERTQRLNRMNQELIREVAERRSAETAMAAAKETAEAASKAKSAFLANMSHEIRTPMNGILGMAQLLADTTLDDTQQGFLKGIEESATSLLSLINNILDFSKIEADRLELAHDPFVPRDLLRSVASTLGVLAQGKGLQLTLDIGPEVPDLLLGDADRLRQVLVNLVGNAIKFTEHGQVRISVHGLDAGPIPEAPDAEARQRLAFSISDTGIGIHREDMTRIFDAFTQADGSYTRRFGGTGLGLTICRRLVEHMGGEISLESEPGQGTIFTFTAVFGLEAPLPGHPEATATETASHLPPLRILLADDNRINRDILESQLTRGGHTVTTADNGRDALEAATTQAFDLLLLDIQMPYMDGLQAAQAIRALPEPNRAGVFIAAITAHVLPGDRKRCLAAGINDYLAKPVARAELDRVLTAATEARSQEDASGRPR